MSEKGCLEVILSSQRARAIALLAALAMLEFTAALDAQARASHNPLIDRYVRTEMATRRIPGLALLVAKNHRIVYAANYGVANLELQAPVTERTSFEIASMSKQFTDAAILLLADRGKLDLDDQLPKFFTDLPAAWNSITLRQLMTHTAGLRDDWDEDDPFFYSKTTPLEFFDVLKAAPLKFPPGTSFSYGSGPFVLGLVIERVSGQSYAAFMREHIFRPLGMSSTDVNDPVPVVPGRASGYVIRGDSLRNGVRISPAAEARGDVGIRSAARDLMRWDAALDGSTLLSEGSRRAMFTPGRLTNGEVVPYGFGWYILPFRGHTEISHDGGFRTGFRTTIARYPDDSLTVVVLTNLQGPPTYAIARAVAAFYDPDYRPIPAMSPQADHFPDRTATVTRLIEAIRDGQPMPDLRPEVRWPAGYTLSQVRAMLAGAPAPVFIDCQDLQSRQVEIEGARIVANCFYRIEGTKMRYWTISFAADGRVAYFEPEE